MQKRIVRIVGLLGAAGYALYFATHLSFPTPDKILIFATFLALAYGQARELLKRFVPFVILLLVYESFRGLVPGLNARVNFGFMPAADRLLFFGHLPTVLLQKWWWAGHLSWYDFGFYIVYMLHFVLPFALAAYIWKTKEKQYWRYVTTFVIVSFAGFLTYLAFPAAPPWMASEKGLIEPIAHVSSDIWHTVHFVTVPTVYNSISPNPVAAVPSLHAAYSFLFAFYVTRLYKPKWRLLAWLYPFLIWLGTIYMGEHYIIDAILGVMYGAAAYWMTPYVLRRISSGYHHTLRFLRKRDILGRL